MEMHITWSEESWFLTHFGIGFLVFCLKEKKTKETWIEVYAEVVLELLLHGHLAVRSWAPMLDELIK